MTAAATAAESGTGTESGTATAAATGTEAGAGTATTPMLPLRSAHVSDELQKEVDTYEAHRAELVARAEGKHVLIKGDRVLGIFDTRDAALDWAYRELGYVAIFVTEIAAVDRVETL